MRIHYGTSWKERTSKDVNSDKSLKKEINGRGGDGKKEEENAEWIQLISSNISNIFGRLGINLCVDKLILFHEIFATSIKKTVRGWDNPLEGIINFWNNWTNN